MKSEFIINAEASAAKEVKVPPYFLFNENGQTEVRESDFAPAIIKAEDSANGQVFPLMMRAEGGEWWTLPIEPHVSINGSNEIVKKQIAKGKVRGTVKERWMQGDYEISIDGILIGKDGRYPESDVRTLRSLCENAKLEVSCPLLDMYSVYRIAVDSFSFPFTSGPENQAYTISAVSDDIYQLLLKKDDLKQL